MDWAAPLSAIAGALAGIVATYFVDRGRLKATRETESQQILREAFVSYLSHLARASERMREVAGRDHATPADRRQAIRAAWTEIGLYEQRFALTMLGPERVIALGIDAFRKVRIMRDVLEDGGSVADPEFKDAQRAYFAAVEAAANAMREELGGEPVNFPGLNGFVTP
ncbi:MAG: hypothetical protein HOV68_14830 [Streptomycetaceae bacterium]|nr:hypothetical protein [Streptomycetaceae bacterium]